MKITTLSDAHWKFREIEKKYLPGGDLLIYAGDFCGAGYKHELQQFCKWYNNIEGYATKIFIAGNHERYIEENYEDSLKVIDFYKTIHYIQDETFEVNGIKIYGSPWSPVFNDWAFNLPINGKELETKWSNIPEDTDILVTHVPPFGVLDKYEDSLPIGCEVLKKHVGRVQPKLHVFGHVHSGYGYMYDGTTNYINCAVLNGHYFYRNPPLTFDWNMDKNELNFYNIK